jgi:hypothetical protein
MWRPGCSQSNVWVAQLSRGAATGALVLDDLRPVQKIRGDGHPFARLVGYLSEGHFRAAAIDAPFSIPRQFVGPGGHSQLLDHVQHICLDGRPFPRGTQLVDIALTVAPIKELKPLRATERCWVARGVNTRSTLWAGARGGAPFAAACLKLIALSGRPCWPWVTAPRGLLVEAFPAAQLRNWELPHVGYDGLPGVTTRERIISDLVRRIDIPAVFLEEMSRSADALDAVLSAFAAVGVSEGIVRSPPSEFPRDEGWIAVHP